MPQNNASFTVASTATNTPGSLKIDSSGGLRVSGLSATGSSLNISVATLVKATAGFVVRVSVIAAGSVVGSINDAATIGAAATANQIASVPNTVGVITVEFPCVNGIVVTPGTGQVLAVAFS